jgi:quercetin dioxygenase-like cupin family protein
MFGAGVGVAVGKEPRQARYIAREALKWVELMPILKIAVLTGDKDKGPFTALLTLSNGVESPWHSHTGDYEAVEIQGTSKHWMKGEDGARAKRMTPGSYWHMPGGVDHISAGEKGPDCVMVVWQKTKFDSLPGRDATGAPPAPAAPLAKGAAHATTAKPAASSE